MSAHPKTTSGCGIKPAERFWRAQSLLTRARLLALILSVVVASPPRMQAARSVARSLPSHPGNIFLTDEDVLIPLPAAWGAAWRLLDYEGNTVRDGHVEQGQARLGRLRAGYYELAAGDGNPSRVSLGILTPLAAPTPLDSPIGIDVAMAWSFPQEKMASVANLCVLAGMNRVRDRLSWEAMEPKRGEFITTSNQYDYSAQVQAAAGLQILQVNHLSPSWANPVAKRFPPDLRDVFAFYRAMAQRWRGPVAAFEPWNEADISMFGGHTGSEMATLQKAAYLGLKAGNSSVVACLNVFAIHRAATLHDFDRNEAWPYFDTFNLHHYETLQKYPQLYADFRAVSAGKPLWVSECSVHVKWSGDAREQELSEEDARLQSERLTKTYSLAIYQGAAAVFYFMLPHYTEGQLQYGVLHRDLTPRPAFLALGAVGRLLAGAEPIGRVEIGDQAGQAYFFRAEPDGQPADVAVVWARNEQDFSLPAEPRACLDHLGRAVPVTGKAIKVGQAPLYLLFEKGAHPPTLPPPKRAKILSGKPGSLVLQALLPEPDTVLEKSAYRIPAGQKKTIPLFLYNFGGEPAQGTLNATAPSDWTVELQREARTEPGGRTQVPMALKFSGRKTPAEADIRITGDFGAGGQPVLSMHLAVE